MKYIYLFVLLVLGAPFLSATTNQEVMQEAKGAIQKMGKALKSNMKKNMKAGGPLQAAKFCSQEASNIEKKINASYKDGVSVKRISLKYRNPNNKPSADELKVLQSIENDIAVHKKVPKMIVKKIAPNHYKVYKPMFIQKAVCLTCHGDAKTRSIEAYTLIKEKYPHDLAVNYKEGDFRGAMVAEIVK